MKGFVYNGKSTEDILSVPLILATFDSIDSIQGVSKTDNIGNQTITRETPNEYGTINTLPSFQYGLIKSDGSVFTDEEQRIVEKWLTSPRFSKELQVVDYNTKFASLRDEYFFDYNGNGDITEGKDVFYSVIDYEYDINGNLIFQKDNQNASITYTYADGLLTSSIDRNGTTIYKYDENEYLQYIIKPDNLIYTYEYTNNNLSRINISNGNYVRYYYDELGFLTSEESNNGDYIYYKYENGFMVSSVDKHGLTSYKYDEDHNITEIIYPDGEKAKYIYNSNNQLIRAIEPDRYYLKKNIYPGNPPFYYYGRFTETNWYPCCGGYAGLMFTFNCGTAYPYRKYFNTFILDGNDDIEFNCITDNTDDYVYPTIYFSSTSDNTDEFNFSIESMTDDSNKLKAIMKSGTNIVMDCEHCIIWNYKDKNDASTREEYTFSDIGWDDLDNIYWCRLIYGINKWKVLGKGILNIEYKSTYKKVGGWL